MVMMILDRMINISSKIFRDVVRIISNMEFTFILMLLILKWQKVK